jgi:hypothetical protein
MTSAFLSRSQTTAVFNSNKTKGISVPTTATIYFECTNVVSDITSIINSYFIGCESVLACLTYLRRKFFDVLTFRLWRKEKSEERQSDLIW